MMKRKGKKQEEEENNRKIYTNVNLFKLLVAGDVYILLSLLMFLLLKQELVSFISLSLESEIVGNAATIALHIYS